MPTTLRWTRRSTFADRERGESYGPGEHELPDDVAEEYLDHRTGAWERVEEAKSDASADAGDDTANGSDADEGDSEAASADADEAPTEVGPAVEGQEPQKIVEPPFDPSESTVGELEDALEAGDYSEAELDALYSAEREAEDRTTAVEAIEDALDALDGEG